MFYNYGYLAEVLCTYIVWTHSYTHCGGLISNGALVLIRKKAFIYNNWDVGYIDIDILTEEMFLHSD